MLGSTFCNTVNVCVYEGVTHSSRRTELTNLGIEPWEFAYISGSYRKHQATPFIEVLYQYTIQFSITIGTYW